MIFFFADAIADVTSTVSGYVTGGIAVGVAILMFCLGRRVLDLLVDDSGGTSKEYEYSEVTQSWNKKGD